MAENIFKKYDYIYNGKIKTKIIADSQLEKDVRVTTFLLRIPRFILPEITRHRVYSFSIDSSRARSNETKSSDIWKDSFVPRLPLAEHKGMQGYEFIDDKTMKDCQTLWFLAMQDMIDYAQKMNELGLTHQYTNRLLEPFMYIDVLMTGTNWDNFLSLRMAKDAQFEIQVCARQIQKLLINNKPNRLDYGEFHLPFISRQEKNNLTVYEQCMVSSTRCARVSYINPEDSKHTVEQNINLATKLLKNKHMSPFEAQVQNLSLDDGCGNLDGGIQFRKLIEKFDGDLETIKTWCKRWTIPNETKSSLCL